MADDQMRIKAVVDYDPTGLKKLNSDLKAAGTIGTGKTMAHDFKGVREQVGGVTRELNSLLAPALRGIGISSLGGVAAITGLAVGVRNLAKSGRDLKYFSDQVQMPINKIREFQALGERFNVPASQMQGNLRAFQNNMWMLSKHWGETYNALRGMNAGNIATDLEKSLKHGGPAEAFEMAIDDLKKVYERTRDPVLLRKLSEVVFGDDLSNMIIHQTKEMRRQVTRRIGQMTNEQLQESEELEAELSKTNELLSQLKTKGTPLIRLFNHTLQNLNSMLQMFNDHGIGALTKPIEPGSGRPLPPQLKLFKQKIKEADLATAERRLVDLDKNIADAKRFGRPAPEIDLDMQDRKRLIEEITKLRKEIEGQNKNQLLQKQSFLGGIGVPKVIPAVYTGGINGAASGGGVPPRMGGSGGGMPGPGTGGMPGGALPRGKRGVAQAAAEEMRRAGMSDSAIAGIFANVQDESNFNPNLRHPDQPRWGGEAHYAHGLFQEGGAEWNRYCRMAEEELSGSRLARPAHAEPVPDGEFEEELSSGLGAHAARFALRGG